MTYEKNNVGLFLFRGLPRSFLFQHIKEHQRNLIEISGAKILNNLPYLQVIQQVI